MSWRYSMACPAMKYAPIRKEITYQKRSLRTSPRSAANTPIWQVTLDRTRTVVLNPENNRLNSACGHSPPWAFVTERIVKYIANSAAKNMSSDDNQTIVPTLTRLGRFALGRGGVSTADAVATGSIITAPGCRPSRDPPLWVSHVPVRPFWDGTRP